ncbi:hypothetical protein COCON_G00152090 [Conger conger]|uniref:Testis-expressed protein 43 n=1 Tax=Conger conger TaxID=82655 RepID=A0A9Q1D8E8_CONCO|nr:sperm-associated microtubule inner protein 10-like [Conger conger]KAJ8262752.1 hypothetical protein COCON_G00152090 [Conger conger]
MSTKAEPNKSEHSHMPAFSVRHPMIPKLYVMPWKQDMKNHRLLLKNVSLAQIPRVAHEDSLFLESSERLCHGQDRVGALDPATPGLPHTCLPPPTASHLSRYNSSLATTRGLYGQAPP